MGAVLRLLMLTMAFAGFGAAQGSPAGGEPTAQLPPCALACLITAFRTSRCSQTDVQCQCTDPDFINSSKQCVMSNCGVVDALTTQNITQTQCGAPIRDRSVEYNVVSTTLLSIGFLLVILRIGYKKLYTSMSLGLDDWFIILALVAAVPTLVLNVVALSGNGLGKDIWTLTPDMITNFSKTFYIVTILYFFESFVLKLSILFFYLKIFPGPDIRHLLWTTVGVDVAFGLTFVLGGAFQCTPVSYNWTSWRGEGGGTCINISALAWANGGTSIALDLWMLALPLSQLRSLQLNWKKKVGVGLMFFVGTFATVISIIRLSSLVQFRGSSNITQDFWSVSVWSTVEITVSIICACMPALRVILMRIAPPIFATENGSSINKPSLSSQRSKAVGRPLPNFSKKPPVARAPSITTSLHSIGDSDENFLDRGASSFMATAGFGGPEEDELRLLPLDLERADGKNVIKVSTRFSMRSVEQAREPMHPIYDQFGSHKDSHAPAT